MSGQIPLDPKTMQIVEGGIEAQAHQVFRNLRAVAAAAGATLDDIVKLSILMADIGEFAKVNEIMGTYFHAPYPARATYQVAALPRAARIEVEATAVVPTSALAADAQTGWRETFDQTKGQ
jgi:reactive intermediate/imine deaminase